MRGLLGEDDAPVPVPEPGEAAKAVRHGGKRRAGPTAQPPLATTTWAAVAGERAAVAGPHDSESDESGAEGGLVSAEIQRELVLEDGLPRQVAVRETHAGAAVQQGRAPGRVGGVVHPPGSRPGWWPESSCVERVVERIAWTSLGFGCSGGTLVWHRCR